MLFQTALLAGLLLSGHASAKLNSVFKRSEDIEDVLRRDAEMLATLTRRQDSNLVERQVAPTSTPASGDASKADLTKWETETKAACMNALTQLNGQASNPTGLAVCYNLPFLDNSTGVFQAELRLYNVSAPINPWNGVTAADVSMTLSYLGATVQSMNGTFIKREIEWPPVRRDDGSLVERQTGSSAAPVELKVLNYVGRINSNLMGSAMTQATLQPLLVPQIELAAKNPNTNQDVTATLSSQEASFVNGVFAKQAASTLTGAAAAASASAQVLASAPFILPGVNLAFLPIGLIVTGTWMILFFAIVGAGTVGRIQFREQYRRRMKNEMARGVRTI